MGKTKKDRLQLVEKRIKSLARQLGEAKAGSLYYRTVLYNLEDTLCIRKGLKLLKDKGEL